MQHGYHPSKRIHLFIILIIAFQKFRKTEESQIESMMVTVSVWWAVVTLSLLFESCVLAQYPLSKGCNDTSSFLVWNAATSKCTPLSICENINLNQIPDFSGHFPSSILCNASVDHPATLSRLYDKAATRSCLQNKKLCVLGDSTLEESIHDIIVLLSGMGVDKSRVHAYYDKMRYATHPIKMTIDDIDMNLMGSGNSGDRAHRLMEVNIKAINFTLYHHFTGHRLIGANGEGITALIFRVQDLFYSKLYDCDVLLFNSAAHDFQQQYDNQDCQQEPQAANSTCLFEFVDHVKELRALLTGLYGNTSFYSSPAAAAHPKSTVKLYWKGDAYSAGIGGFIPNSVKMALEAKVAAEFRSVDSKSISSGVPNLPVTFINITGPIAEIPFKMTHARIHHIGQNSNREKSPISLLWSSMSTQVILDHICT